MSNRVIDKVQKAVDMILSSTDRTIYVEIGLYRTEYPLAWKALNELEIFDISNIYIKLMVDDTYCKLIIGAGNLTTEDKVI